MEGAPWDGRVTPIGERRTCRRRKQTRGFPVVRAFPRDSHGERPIPRRARPRVPRRVAGGTCAILGKVRRGLRDSRKRLQAPRSDYALKNGSLVKQVRAGRTRRKGGSQPCPIRLRQRKGPWARMVTGSAGSWFL